MDRDGIKEIIAKDAQGAVMYFGVNDDYEVVGLKSTKYIRSI